MAARLNVVAAHLHTIPPRKPRDVRPTAAACEAVDQSRYTRLGITKEAAVYEPMCEEVISFHGSRVACECWLTVGFSRYDAGSR